MLGVSQRRGSRMRPDYFALVDAVTSSQPHLPGFFLYSIECKGSFGSIHNRQLRKAACQVQSVHHGLGQAPPSLLFATGVLKSGFRVRVLDPEGEGWVATRKDVAGARSSLDQLAPPDTDGIWHIEDVPGFLRGLLELGEAALLSFAGQYRTAVERAPRLTARGERPAVEEAAPRDPLRPAEALVEEAVREPRPPVDRELESPATGAAERGARLSMPLHDGRLLQAFTGVQAARLEAARAGDLQRLGTLRETTPAESERGREEARREGCCASRWTTAACSSYGS